MGFPIGGCCSSIGGNAKTYFSFPTVEWDRTRKERLKTLPEDLKKHGLEYSAESMWCTAYIEQYEDNMMRFGMVPGAGKLTLERVVNELCELAAALAKFNF